MTDIDLSIRPKRSDPGYQRWWRKVNPESNRRSQIKYYKANKEKRLALARANKRKAREKNPMQEKLRSLSRQHFLKAIITPQFYSDFMSGFGHEIKARIQSLFKRGMNWRNYGVHGWCVDHIVPISSFDLNDKEQVAKAFHYKNTQPLWFSDNCKKYTMSMEQFTNQHR